MLQTSEEFVEEIAHLLINKSLKAENENKKYGKLGPQELKDQLKELLRIMDFKIFNQLNTGKISLDQARARLYNIHYGIKYKVIDDFKPPVINQKIYDASRSAECEKQFLRMYGTKNIENVTIE